MRLAYPRRLVPLSTRIALAATSAIAVAAATTVAPVTTIAQALCSCATAMDASLVRASCHAASGGFPYPSLPLVSQGNLQAGEERSMSCTFYGGSASGLAYLFAMPYLPPPRASCQKRHMSEPSTLLV